MNEDRLKGNWNRFKGKIKEKWGKLTDDEFFFCFHMSISGSLIIKSQPALVLGDHLLGCGASFLFPHWDDV